MWTAKSRLRVIVANSLVACVALTCSEAANAWQQAPVTTSGAQQTSAAMQMATASTVANAPGMEELPPAPAPQSQSAESNQTNTQQPPQQNNNPQENTRQPAGTAVAPYDTGVGVAASRPAGAAIAPAKQKRTRSLLIKVGLLVGAGVALGTVAGLSMASPSKPH